MKTILLSFFSLVTLCGLAQEKKVKQKTAWSYAGSVTGGLISGSSGVDYAVQTIQGIKKGAWMLGVGGGIDHYTMPGFPVVAHGQFHYGNRRSKPFAYAQAGPQFPWVKNEWANKFGDSKQYEMKTGWLAEGGIGYSIPMGKRLKFLSSLGYSIKQARYDEMRFIYSAWSSFAPWPGGGDPANYSENKLTMYRLVLKLGVQF